ncbi:MAG TPA: hypothetical protein DCE41_33315, partial [Cytophagales bacterium]|nr:hypothetical protein [Cytophagales bacterium]
MKTRFSCLIVLCIVLTSNCSPEKEASHTQVIEAYFNALNHADFGAVADQLADTVVFGEGEYLTTYSLAEYQIWWQWDSVFQPEYTLLDVKEVGETVEAKFAKQDVRIRYLHQDPVINLVRYSFKEGKLHRSVILSYEGFDDERWRANREVLVNWAAEHHPEL